jgi:polysaccharide deacetylase family protein (PEP-CTERM system associated)
MQHGLSIDVEDYYQIIYSDYFGKKIPPSPEVERNTHWILDELGRHGTKGTFFTLGNVAQQFPSLIQRIAREGHELAVHGHEHKYISKMSQNEFREELKQAKGIIEDTSSCGVLGHRAPAFSITRESFWALDVLREEGFMYDSSIYPIKGKRYGIEGASKAIYQWPNGLYEIPLSCIELFSKTIPVAGGGYLRHFPYWWTKYAMSYLKKMNRPAIVYMHPYEFENTYPTIDKPVHIKLKIHTLLQAHNRGTKQREKFKSLLSDFLFIPLRSLIEQRTMQAA